MPQHDFYETSYNIAQCPENLLIKFGDNRLGILWKSSRSSGTIPTHLIDFTDGSVRSLSAIGEDPKFDHVVFPLSGDWTLKRGGEGVECNNNIAMADTGDLIVDEDGTWFVGVLQSSGAGAFGFLGGSCGRRKPLPQSGIVFKTWGLEIIDGRGVKVFGWDR